MTKIRTKEAQETNMQLLSGVNIWMRMRTLCEVRRTSVINIPGAK